jgi:hypothetical protein
MSESEDAARYRWLIENCVKMADSSRDGPEHPELYLYADLFNEHPNLPAKVRIEQEIDRRRTAWKHGYKYPR